ncbi:hypothetical protein ANAEL_00269 [Anaerolineales bacterium]|nr:hypothetical protein ANAEL_00269 [Anaerolineales bacterium]
MANLIKCPNCGENNLADMEFCQYCQSRLQPLSGDLQEEGKPLTPGQVPTKKSTGDLEPILPQWLREARNSARQFSDEDSQQVPESSQKPQEAPSTPSGADLLAGLHSQSDDEEEEIPDWLANITGEKPKPKKSQPESSEVRWVELGGKKDLTQPTPEPESDVPSWLSGMAPSTPPPGQKDEFTDWSRSADAEPTSQQPSQPLAFDEQPAGESQDWLHSMVPDDGMAFNDAAAESNDEPFIASDTPDWLRGLESPTTSKDSSAAPAFSDAPDWLKAMDAEAAASKPSAQPETPSVPSDSPDWLKAMGGEHTAFTPSAQPESSDAPDWLKSMGGESAAITPGTQPEPSDAPDWLKTMQEEGVAAPSSSSDMPDWLRAMGDQGQAQGADSTIFAGSGLGESESVSSPSGEEESDWLKGLESSAPPSDQDWLKGFQSTEEKQSAQPEKPAQGPAPVSDDAGLDIPSWLKAAAPQASIFGEPPTESKEPEPAADAFETPDWLKAFKSVEASEAQTSSTPLPNEPASPVPSVSKGGPQPAADADSLFTEMPDWLSIRDDTIAPEPVAPITNVDAIAPGDLPSWVQAMRPVDAGPQAVTSLSGDRTLETNGALAGLQGVLPAAPGFTAVRKPKAHSIKLQASEEQQQHAGLLEQILSAETEPVPIGSSFSMLGTSRVLRWLLSVLVFAALAVVLIMRTEVFATPTGFPVEAVSAWNIVKDSIPTDGRVLVIFDYEPARAGEIEAVALPMFDQMIRLHFPRLTFISTNETGLILAERFISSKPLNGIGENGYESGSQYLNLGYLPGGQMGIRAFSANPFGTMKYAAPQTKDIFKFAPDLSKAFPPTDGVDTLSQFSALFLLTDDADSARAWIEQTKSMRGDIPIPFVVVSSAQAAPMLQPYYASGQINGLASGLYDGALFEQKDTDGKPNTVRAYWDAHSVGMLLAMTLILGGGLFSLALGLRDRVAAREAK